MTIENQDSDGIESEGQDFDSTATPELDSYEQESGDEGSAENSDAKPTHRSLAELRDAAEAIGGRPMSKEEAKRVRLAAMHGLSSDEEIDAHLQGDEPAPKKAKGNEEDEEEESEEDAPKPPKPEAKPKQDPAVDPKLADVFKAISPNIKDPEQAIQSIKHMQRALTEQGTEVKTLRSQLQEATQQADQLDQVLEQHLSSEQGFQKLLDAYFTQHGKAIPPHLQGGRAAQPAPKGLSDAEFDKLEDGDFLTKNQVAGILSRQMATFEENFAKKFGNHESTMTKLQGLLQAEEHKRQRVELRNRSLGDFHTIAQEYGSFFPEFKTRDSVQKIWNESVEEYEEDGQDMIRFRAEPHPEFETLRKIIDLRKEYLEARRRQGKQGPATIEDFVLRKMKETRSLHKVREDAAAKARTQMLDNRANRLQPSGMAGGRSASADSFKVLTGEEFDKLPPSQRKEYGRQLQSRIRRGEVTVKD